MAQGLVPAKERDDRLPYERVLALMGSGLGRAVERGAQQRGCTVGMMGRKLALCRVDELGGSRLGAQGNGGGEEQRQHDSFAHCSARSGTNMTCP